MSRLKSSETDIGKFLDPAILAALPPGCEVVAVNSHGKGSWSAAYKIDVEVNVTEAEYLLKVLHRPNHQEMALGEFESQKKLAKYLPDNTVIPLAHGVLENDPSASFSLTGFRSLSDNIPSPVQLVDVLEKLHKNSISPNGKFGFHVNTFNGVVPIVNEWCNTWEEYFTRQLRYDIEWEHSIRGPDPEFDAVAERFIQVVIPRLLRPLETGGRSIKPSLVHGDVWHGNVQIDIATQQVMLFDSCCCYAHNEFDLSMMREPRYLFTGGYADKHKEVVRPSEPVGDFDDRNALYAMHGNSINSGLHEARAYLRDQVKEEMQRLIAKHPRGINGFEHRNNFQNIA
ncbi:Fructosamine kinase-domain-containing protein [Xylariales sp. PMI_506]|nr:Fructosamine kinase-domain-containing protein [Xylariales sp. PMI_506]